MIERMEGDVLVTHLHQHQPSIIPASVAIRIIAHTPLRIVQHVAAEGVIARQTAQFVKEVVGRHIVRPGRSHRLLEGKLVFFGGGGGYTLDATEFSQGVDAVSV